MTNLPRTSFDRLLQDAQRSSRAIDDLYCSRTIFEETSRRRKMLEELSGPRSLLDEARRTHRALNELRQGGVVREALATKRLFDDLGSSSWRGAREQARSTWSALRALDADTTGRSFGQTANFEHRRYLEASALRAGAEAASVLHEAMLGKGRFSDLLSDYREMGLRNSEAVAQMRAYRDRSEFGARISEQVAALTGSWAGTALEARRLAQSRRAGDSLLQDPYWQRLARSLEELTKPLGSLIDESRLVELNRRRPRDWLETVKADERFWSEATAQIEGLGESRDGIARRLLDLVQSVTAHLWANTKDKSKRLNLFDLVNLLGTLVGLAVFLGQFGEARTPEAADGQPEASALEAPLTEAMAILERSIAAVTAWMEIQASEHLGKLSRAETRGQAMVRSGPGTSFPRLVRLPAGAALAVRERRIRWRLVVYRDPLTGSLEEGWISAGMIEELE